MTLRTALRDQAVNNETLGSPFTARILRLLADRIAPGVGLTDRLFAWEGDIGPSGASVPLRLLGGLHALVLSGRAPGLAAAYPPNPAPDDDTLWREIDIALHDHGAFLNGWIDSPPQTNEVRRSAVLIAAGHWLTQRFDLPIRLSELGASGGLNLMWDHFALDLGGNVFGPKDAKVRLAPDWTGQPPPHAAPRVDERRGVDLNPLDPHDLADALRLTAYLWADQPERLARTRAAIALNDATLDRGDAAAWLERRLAHTVPGTLHLVYHTISWQYFPAETQDRCTAALARAGAQATDIAPLAHLAMEADGGHGAGLSLTTWPGGNTVALGRADFHGRWVEWRAD